MATATLSVNGYIDSYDYYDTTSLKMLKDALVLQAPFEAVSVEINSGGGSVTEGLAIHDWLKSLNVPVTTIAIGCCYSIAGPIFMAGSVRLIGENADVMIHPVSGWAEGTAEDIRAYADLMENYGEKIINIYTANTGQSADAIREMMDKTTYLNATQCVDMGIATGLYSQAQARADRRLQLVNYAARKAQGGTSTASTNPQPSAMSKPKKLSVIEATLRGVTRATNKALGQPVNLDLTLQDGSTVFVDSTAETPAQGDKVYTDSTMTTAVADGTYTLTDGATITVASGVITAITTASTSENTETPANNAGGDDVAALKAEITRLEGVIAANNTANATQVTELTNAVTSLGSLMTNALGKMHSPDVDISNKSGKSTNKNIPGQKAEDEKPDANEEFKKRQGLTKPDAA